MFYVKDSGRIDTFPDLEDQPVKFLPLLRLE
jgi:hypothetical protein